MRNASPIARWDEASAQVIVLLGPIRPWTIVTWQASMFGRYFSSHSGVSRCIPSPPAPPHLSRSSTAGSPSLRAVSSAAASSSRSQEISPAPMLHPNRAGSKSGSWASAALLIPADRKASAAAITASSMSRAITLAALR